MIYIKLSFRQLINEMKVELDMLFVEKLEIKQWMYTGFNIMLIVIYIFLWRPFVMRLNREIWSTKGMLNMIPINVVTRIKTVREFLMHSNKMLLGNIKIT